MLFFFYIYIFFFFTQKIKEKKESISALQFLNNIFVGWSARKMLRISKKLLVSPKGYISDPPPKKKCF